MRPPLAILALAGLLALPLPLAAQQCVPCAGKGRSPCETCKGKGQVVRDLLYQEQLVAPQVLARCGSCAGLGGNVCLFCSGRGRALSASEVACPHCSARGGKVCPDCDGFGQTGKHQGIERKLTPVVCKGCAGAGVLACKECRGGRILALPVRLAEADAFVCPACPAFPDLRKSAGGKCALCRGALVLRLPGFWTRLRQMDQQAGKSEEGQKAVSEAWLELEKRRFADYPPQWRPQVAATAMLWALRELNPGAGSATQGLRVVWDQQVRKWLGALDPPGTAARPLPTRALDPLEAAGQLWPAAKADFAAADKDADGQVTPEELQARYKDAGRPVPDARGMRAHDAGGDGRWDLLEFASWWIAGAPRRGR